MPNISSIWARGSIIPLGVHDVDHKSGVCAVQFVCTRFCDCEVFICASIASCGQVSRLAVELMLLLLEFAWGREDAEDPDASEEVEEAEVLREPT